MPSTSRPPEPSPPVTRPSPSGGLPAVPRRGSRRTSEVRAVARALLSPARRATLDAVCARLLDGALDVVPPLVPGALVEARMQRMPAGKRDDLLRVLDVFGSRAAALAGCGLPVPFARLAPARQDAMLARWARGPLPLQRTVFQALRRLVLATWYGHPEVQEALRYRGPLHARLHDGAARVDWEGPAPGESTDAEPIARTGHPERVRPPVASAALPVRHAGPAGMPVRGRIVRGAGLTGDVALTADVVVVGTGAGGAVVAARLAEAGREVVVLEAGALFTSDDFDEREAELTERLYAEQGLRATEDLAVSLLQGATVGGSTTVNWMIMLRPDAHVRDEWARRFGVAAVAAPGFDAALDRVWQDVHARAVPADAHSPNNRLLLAGAEALGWRARGAEINARGCVRAGFCGQGCRYDAKQGTLVTYVPRALAAGATVYSDVEARRVEVVERSAAGDRLPRKRVTAVVDGGRATLTVEAPLVVLAGGAVGTPVLLQQSGMGGGGVGRYLRLHPTTAVSGDYGHEIAAGAGIPLTTVCDQFASTGAHGYGFWIETPPVHPMLAAVATSGFGRVHAERVRRYPELGTFVVLVRDGADLDHSSGEVRLDASGRPRIDYRLSAADARHLREGMAAAARLHLAAGAREVRTLHTDAVVVRREADVAAILGRSTAANDVTLFSAHVNGTCRLGRDAATSGCAADAERLGERHGVRGLYVADGSLLPTGLGVNPQATIMALAHLVADGILARAH